MMWAMDASHSFGTDAREICASTDTRTTHARINTANYVELPTVFARAIGRGQDERLHWERTDGRLYDDLTKSTHTW
jgi:hypothetical protein